MITERVEVSHGGFSVLRQHVKHEKSESVGDLIDEMGRERLALRCKTTLVVLLCVSAFLCLAAAFATVMGYLPYAVGPAVALLVTSMIGFVASILEARQTPIATTAFESTSRPGEAENFQRPNQFFYTHYLSTSFDLVHACRRTV